MILDLGSSSSLPSFVFLCVKNRNIACFSRLFIFFFFLFKIQNNSGFCINFFFLILLNIYTGFYSFGLFLGMYSNYKFFFLCIANINYVYIDQSKKRI